MLLFEGNKGIYEKIKLHTYGCLFMLLKMISTSQENRGFFSSVNHRFLCKVCMNYNTSDLKLSFNNVTFAGMKPDQTDAIENLKVML